MWVSLGSTMSNVTFSNFDLDANHHKRLIQRVLFGKFRLLLPLVLTTAFLGGCASPAYRANYSECERLALAEYPPNMQQTVDTLYRNVEVPTGVTNCTTFYNQTTCRQQTRIELQPYQVTGITDLNSGPRFNHARNCAQQRCYSSHGNAGCK